MIMKSEHTKKAMYLLNCFTESKDRLQTIRTKIDRYPIHYKDSWEQYHTFIEVDGIRFPSTYDETLAILKVAFVSVSNQVAKVVADLKELGIEVDND